jgi:predicted restriction endonuclease
MTATSHFQIIRDGYFFRAVNAATGYRSSLVTSASQAGKLIQKIAGKDAHRAAAERFLSAA